jgi:hypothetical protein
MQIYGPGQRIGPDPRMTREIERNARVMWSGGWRWAVVTKMRLKCDGNGRNGHFTPDACVFRYNTKQLWALIRIGDLSAGRETMRYLGYGVNCYVLSDWDQLERALLDIRLSRIRPLI